MEDEKIEQFARHLAKTQRLANHLIARGHAPSQDVLNNSFEGVAGRAFTRGG